jgi:hypothetical protein
MPGLVPGIHVSRATSKGVDGRDKPRHDARSESMQIPPACRIRSRSSHVSRLPQCSLDHVGGSRVGAQDVAGGLSRRRFAADREVPVVGRNGPVSTSRHPGFPDGPCLPRLRSVSPTATMRPDVASHGGPGVGWRNSPRTGRLERFPIKRSSFDVCRISFSENRCPLFREML